MKPYNQISFKICLLVFSAISFFAWGGLKNLTSQTISFFIMLPIAHFWGIANIESISNKEIRDHSNSGMTFTLSGALITIILSFLKTQYLVEINIETLKVIASASEFATKFGLCTFILLHFSKKLKNE